MEEYSKELKVGIVQDPPKKVMEGHIDSKKNIKNMGNIGRLQKTEQNLFLWDSVFWGVGTTSLSQFNLQV